MGICALRTEKYKLKKKLIQVKSCPFMKNVVGIKESKTLLRSVTVKTLDHYTNDVYMHVAWGGVGWGGGQETFFLNLH